MVGYRLRRAGRRCPAAPLIDAALHHPPACAVDSPLSRALLTLGHRHTALAITKPVTPVIGEFQVNINDAVRPYRVLNIADFVTATTEAITNPALTQTYRSLLRSAGQGPTEEAR